MNKKFSYFFLFFWSLLTFFYGLNGSESFHISLQELRSTSLDVFLKYVTRLGEWYALVPVIFILAYLIPRNQERSLRLKVLLALFIGLSLGGIFPQVGKMIWSDAPRPLAIIDNLTPIEGLVSNFRKSFPSGHTSITVAWVALWSRLAYPQWRQPLMMAIVALIVALSRVYLNMHWLHDVIVGGFLGFLSAYIGLWAGGFNKTS